MEKQAAAGENKKPLPTRSNRVLDVHRAPSELREKRITMQGMLPSHGRFSRVYWRVAGVSACNRLVFPAILFQRQSTPNRSITSPCEAIAVSFLAIQLFTVATTSGWYGCDAPCRVSCNTALRYLAEELHDPLVLSQVLVPLEEEHVVAPVLPLHGDLAGPLLGGDHLRQFWAQREERATAEMTSRWVV